MDAVYTGLLCRRAAGRASPLEALRALGGEDGSALPFLLASGEGFGAIGRWSFVGARPLARLTFSGRKGRFDLRGRGAEETGNPFTRLRAALSRFPWRGAVPEAPPFFGGWVGAFSYDLARAVEVLPRTARRDLDLPDLHLAFYDQILAYDHAEGAWQACALLREGEAAASAEKRVEGLLDALDRAGRSAPPPLSPLAAAAPKSGFTRAEYERAVERAIEYIRAGDIFQVNLSQRFDLALPCAPFELMGRLLAASPAPFSAYLAFDDKAVLSSSPERFLQVRGRCVETRPIKGTRPRGKTPAEDTALREALLASDKDRAELNMIIDLLRNDLGRVCAYGTVEVREARRLEAYADVFHTVGVVGGSLHARRDMTDLLKAVWPGGSVTGAPKVRAMEIIDELEPTARSFYTGSVGYLGVDGSADLNIAIRTLLYDGRKLTFQVGGGIVADSVPREEYEETLHKARGMLRALGLG
ncbi:MAG: aminodeoxychorismate synthase component I [Planctomycetota bacterium]